MKKLLLLLFLFAIPVLSFSQIPKRASEIIGYTVMPAQDNYNFILSEMFDYEITIDKKDSTNFYIVTDPIKFPTGIESGTYRVKFICRDNKITASMESKIGLTIQLYGIQSTDDWRAIRFEGMGKNHPNKVIFQQWVDFFEKYSESISFK